VNADRNRAAQIRDVDVAGLPGELVLPDDAAGVVLFAHGSGSSRFSPRNMQVAASLQDAGFGTLLFDLLTDDESSRRDLVFDIPLLAERLLAATEAVRADDDVRERPLGYFGASTGAAAALWAAADLGQQVAAVVSRGGRPDLAGPRLEAVGAPTLLIIGGNDAVVLELNREAQTKLRCESELVVIPGASHLFEEPGALETVAGHAAGWFERHLR
jgi:pimeloyl-ACP methyl ester carboxylesterase